MKTIILYGRRNTGYFALTFLLAKGYKVKVVSDDEDVLWLASVFGCEITDFEKMGNDFDLFICCHGNKIIDKKYLVEGKMINIHPCLWKYPGKNPIEKYLKNGDTEATVESQWLIEKVDAGSVIHQENFSTGKINSYEEFYNVALKYYYIVLENTLKKLGL